MDSVEALIDYAGVLGLPLTRTVDGIEVQIVDCAQECWSWGCQSSSTTTTTTALTAASEPGSNTSSPRLKG
jgi:hypothetical protein